MEYIYLSIFSISIITALVFWIIYLKTRKSPLIGFVQNDKDAVKKGTYIFNFNISGDLISFSSAANTSHIFNDLINNTNISKFDRINGFKKYFESCKKSKKNITLKVNETQDPKYIIHYEITFTPIIINEELVSISIVVQQFDLLSENISKQQSLEEQRNVALKLVEEIEEQKTELELAFKKSSKHHITLQKALRKIETQKEELESALKTINKQNAELEKANKEISESSRMKELFLANTSHEIRTPLNAIIGFTNLLINSKLNSSQYKYLENIKASSNHLLVVINDILDFSKIESGKMTIEQIEFDFKNFIKYTINTLSIKAREKNIDLRFDFGSEIPNFIIGDPVRLNQILINLIGNSIKFTPEGGIVQLYTALGEPVEDKVKVLFKVEDNGIGIPNGKLDDIFQSFTQAESNITRNYGGTGLGLSIVKRLIELLGGKISVESEIDKGTSFTFYILLKEGKPTCNSNVNNKIVNNIASVPDNTSILLVEDNDINRQLAYDTIKVWNNKIEIDSAENGKIALEKIIKNNYNLILMDIQMPILDGIEATKLIRELDGCKKNTPIIAMTAHALKNERSNCLKIGMNDYISKPFDPEELYAKIAYYTPTKRAKEEPLTFNSENPLLNKNVGVEIIDLFNPRSLELIYKNNTEKIVKIVKMCHKSIPNEIDELNNACYNKEWDIVKNKAHTLKPKFGYLGMLLIQNTAKNIELKSQKQDEREDIPKLILDIRNYWEKAIPEINSFINYSEK